jgi:alkylhydroperoxidase family enzyme
VKAGVPEAKLAALPDYARSPLFDERERAALAFAEEVVRDDVRDVSDATFAHLRERFSVPEAVEIVFVVGFQLFATKFAKAFRIAPQGYSSGAAAVS